MQQVVDSYCIFSFVDQNRPFGLRAKTNRKNRPFGLGFLWFRFSLVLLVCFWFVHTIFGEILADSEGGN